MKFLLRLALLCLLGWVNVYAQSNLPACQGSDFRNLNNCFAIHTFPDGAKYVGEWKAMMMHGRGTLTSAKGIKYIGEWKDNNYNGQGTLFASNGSVISQGIWADGNFIRSVPLQQVSETNQTVAVAPTQPNNSIGNLPVCQGSDVN